MSKSIVFVTGAFIGNNCWDKWIEYFERKGYKCTAPPWPHKDGSPEELRNRHPDEAIALNRLATLTEYFAAIIGTMPEKPILIGHSLGGLVVQLLLQRGFARAAVAVHSFPPKGVVGFKLSLLKGLWDALGFSTSTQKTYMIPFKKWENAVTNGMTSEEQKQSFYKYAIPESKMIVRDTFKSVAKVNFKNPHAPLLFTSGNLDQIIPSSLNYKNYKKYEPGNSITNYKEFKNRNHFVFDNPASQEEAEFILYWLQSMN